jgi:thioester reductase-like protein
MILITGSTGYLGQKIAEKYLAETSQKVHLWLHASNEDEFAVKWAKVSKALGDSPRLSYSYGELRDEKPFRRVDASRVAKIIHSAAVTRFNVDEETAENVNVAGARKIMEFAETCAGLEAFSLVSSLYASGMRKGYIAEEFLDDSAGFANHYERSKWKCEELLRTRFSSLPWRIFRVATIVADDDSGKVTQQNAIHNTVKLCFYGLVSLLPGSPETPVYLVTGEFAARSCFEATERLPAKRIFNVCHSTDEAITVERMIDAAYEAFRHDADYRSRKLLKPLFTDAESFDTLTTSAMAFGGAVLSQAVSTIAPFGRQLFIAKEIRDQAIKRELESYRAPDHFELVKNTCDYLVKTRFGRAQP